MINQFIPSHNNQAPPPDIGYPTRTFSWITHTFLIFFQTSSPHLSFAVTLTSWPHNKSGAMSSADNIIFHIHLLWRILYSFSRLSRHKCLSLDSHGEAILSEALAARAGALPKMLHQK